MSYINFHKQIRILPFMGCGYHYYWPSSIRFSVERNCCGCLPVTSPLINNQLLTIRDLFEICQRLFGGCTLNMNNNCKDE